MNVTSYGQLILAKSSTMPWHYKHRFLVSDYDIVARHHQLVLKHSLFLTTVCPQHLRPWPRQPGLILVHVADRRRAHL